MAKKKNGKKAEGAAGDKEKKDPGSKEQDEEELSSESSSEEDDDLVLEGVVVRNPDYVSSSSSEEDEEEEDSKGDKKDPNDKNADSTSAKRKANEKPPSKKKKKKAKRKKTDSSDESSSDSDDDDDDNDDIFQVDFVFCDMNEKFWDGLKSLLFNSSTVYQAHSSALADLMIQNVAVGTVVSTEDNHDYGTVFGFCSLLNTRTNQESPAVQYLIQQAQMDCPTKHKSQLSEILSLSSKSNKSKGKSCSQQQQQQTGLLLHGRMMNLPLEIVHVLYQQVLQDLDWAVENAQGGDEERASYNFHHIVRLAPCTKVPIMAAGKQNGSSNNNNNSSASSRSSNSNNLIYRYFDDELLAARADFAFVIPAPKSYSKEEELWLQVMVLNKDSFRAVIQEDLQRLIQG